MLTLCLDTYDGQQCVLPMLLEWSLTHTGSVPCDSMAVTCLYREELGSILPKASHFTALWEGNVMLRGVVDAYEISFSRQGLVATVEGRGMAALLLDNEAEALSYGRASLSEIVANHVLPCGIRCEIGRDDVLDGYSVPAGVSQWRAVRDFLLRQRGYEPYFTREGVLVCAPLWGSGRTITLGDDAPVLELKKREQRYGVISEVVVRDKVQGISQRVVNEDFTARDGQRRQILYMPRSTAGERRYTGQYQIAQSKLEALEIEVTLPLPFAAFPGDRVVLNIERLGPEATYEVVRSRSFMNENGQLTELVLSVR